MKKRTIAIVLSKRFQEENLEILTMPVCDMTTVAVQIDLSGCAGNLEGLQVSKGNRVLLSI